MNQKKGRRNLYILAADQDITHIMNGRLENPFRLGVRPITYTIGKHLEPDPNETLGG